MITQAIFTARTLACAPSGTINVFMLGGPVRPSSIGTNGQWAVDMLRSTNSFTRYAELPDFHTLITDTDLPTSQARRFSDRGPQVTRV